MFPSSRNNSWWFTNDENPNISTPEEEEEEEDDEEEEEEEEEQEQQQQQHTPSSFLQHFTSPFLANDDDDDDDVLDNHRLFSQQQQQQQPLELEATQQQQQQQQQEVVAEMISLVDQPSLSSKKRSTTSTSGGGGGGGKKRQTQPRKRPTGKKDRHSKIYTAQGPRDRRMRLSLQIARKFFDLQDILGFDKASKTIEWLFTKSKSAIKDLMATTTLIPPPQLNNNNNNRTTTCNNYDASEKVVVSQLIKLTTYDHKEIMVGKGKGSKGSKGKGVKNIIDHQRKSRTLSSSSSFHPLSKDCRDKARARARERTREKMIRSCLDSKSKHCYYEDAANPNNSYLETRGEESSSSPSHDMNSPPIIIAAAGAAAAATQVVEEPAAAVPATHLLEHQMATVGIMDKFLGMESSTLASSPSILNYPYHCSAAESSDHHGIYSNDDFLGYDHQGGCWGMENAARIIPQSNYCAITDHIDPNSTGGIHQQQQQQQQQNPSSTGFIITSNVRFQSQFLGN